MTDNRKAGPGVFGASDAFDTRPKFIISACKNQSPFYFVATLIHNIQLCSVCVWLGFDTPAHQISWHGMADILFVLLCQRLAEPNSISLHSQQQFAPQTTGACRHNLAVMLRGSSHTENHTAGLLARRLGAASCRSQIADFGSFAVRGSEIFTAPSQHLIGNLVGGLLGGMRDRFWHHTLARP
jgi:hypothetical protein